MKEEQIDRRAHWAQIAITGIVIATIWCVRLEFTVQELKKDAEEREANVQKNRDNRNADMLKIEQRIRTNEVDIEWLKKGCRGNMP